MGKVGIDFLMIDISKRAYIKIQNIPKFATIYSVLQFINVIIICLYY